MSTRMRCVVGQSYIVLMCFNRKWHKVCALAINSTMTFNHGFSPLYFYFAFSFIFISFLVFVCFYVFSFMVFLLILYFFFLFLHCFSCWLMVLCSSWEFFFYCKWYHLRIQIKIILMYRSRWYACIRVDKWLS